MTQTLIITDRTSWGVAGHAVILAALLIGACVPSGNLASDRAPAPTFDPIVFFAGRTQGTGTLSVVAHHRQSTLVEGNGVAAPDGAIVLDQDVRLGDAPPTHRRWRLQRIAPGRYAGTLTDAQGAVTGTVSGNRLMLGFTLKGGLRARQWLYLRADGQVAQNRMVVTKFGIPVASLDETITRLPR